MNFFFWVALMFNYRDRHQPRRSRPIVMSAIIEMSTFLSLQSLLDGGPPTKNRERENILHAATCQQEQNKKETVAKFLNEKKISSALF